MSSPRRWTAWTSCRIAVVAGLVAGAVPLAGSAPAVDGAGGSAFSWGSNGSGQLGNATMVPSSLDPVAVLGLNDTVKTVGAGGDHSLAVKSDGTLAAWGRNAEGQLGPNSNSASENVPVIVPLPPPSTFDPTPPPVKAVAGGGGHSLALSMSSGSPSGTVMAWGRNTFGQLGDGAAVPGSEPEPSTPRPVKRVEGLLAGVTAIDAGNDHSIALLATGEVVAWGANDLGQLGNGTVAPRLSGTGSYAAPVVGMPGRNADRSLVVKAVAAGGNHSLVLKTQGAVWEWGESYDRNGTTPGAPLPAPVPVSGLESDVTAIAAGPRHALALKSDGSVWAWGSNASGELGTGSFPAAGEAQAVAVPVQVPGLSGVVAVAAGGDSSGGHSVALTAAGTVFAWGAGAAGQLGNGTAANRPSPGAIPQLPGATAIAAGGAHTLAMQAAVPSAPSSVTSTPGNGIATVRWSPPASSGSGAITAYRVSGSQSGSAIVGPDARSAIVSGLNNGTSYTFTVAARNTAGWGRESSPSVVRTGVASISPSAGTANCRVTILGDGFAGATGVDFGGAQAAFETKSPTEIIATTPTQGPGPVDVVVTSPAGTSSPTPDSAFTYTTRRPAVQSLTPGSGNSRGGTEVIIKGSDLCNATAVRFGTEDATSFRVDSPTQITALSPPHAPGVVQVTVEGAGETSSSPPSEQGTFRYYAGDWSPAEQMSEGAWFHTSNLISGTACGANCGKVLLAGGTGRTSGDSFETAVAELYDPATRKWQSTQRLAIPRTQHTATTLTDGDVLVVGGAQNGSEEDGFFGASVAKAERFDASAGTWGPAGESEPRTSHTATLLSNGKVLVTGGRAAYAGRTGYCALEPDCPGQTLLGDPPDQILASAELYEPSTNTWSTATAMSQPRLGHSATMLKDGTVLVVGGTSDGSAQIYHPQANGPGRWTDTESLKGSRRFHTATLLPDGGVLVAGGAAATDGGPATTTELYDPSSVSASGVKGQWADTGSTTSNRMIGSTATLLPTGHVLVTGGGLTSGAAFAVQFDSAGLASTEMYDPKTRTWYPSDPMATARGGAAATLLAEGGVVVSGGQARGSALRSVEVLEHVEVRGPAILSLDPAEGSTLVPTEVRIKGTALFPARQVKFGDITAEIKSITDDELVVVVPPRPQGSVDVIVTTSMGSSIPSPDSRFVYGDGVWRSTQPLADARFLHTTTLLDPPGCHDPTPPQGYPCGQVLVAGGVTIFDGDSLESAEVYEPSTGTWHSTGSMVAARSRFDPRARGRFDHTATLLNDGRVLVAGGQTEDRREGLLTAELYDPTTGKWTRTGDLATARLSHTATLLSNGKVLVAGGALFEEQRTTLATAELFDPAGADGLGAWTTLLPMAQARQLHTAILLPNDEILVTGGLDTNVEGASEAGSAQSLGLAPAAPDAAPLSSTEIYNLGTGLWRSAGALVSPRYSHSATLLNKAPCGANCDKILVVGGYQTTSDASGLASSELYDPVLGTWTPTASVPARARGGHSATALADGTVLVAGGGYPYPLFFITTAPDSAERYDPASGRWRPAASMIDGRGPHGAVLLDGPACRGSTFPSYCGSALVAGGSGSSTDQTKFPPAIASAEIYTPAPTVSNVEPNNGPSLGGTQIEVTGTGFVPSSTVTFGGMPASDVKVESPTRLTAVAPRHAPGPVEVGVINSIGTSAHEPPRLDHAFTYAVSGVPSQVTGLVAAAVSDSQVVLSFRAPSSDGNFPDAPPPADRYVVKQTTAAFTDPASIEAAPSICPPTGCAFTPPEVGAVLSLDVEDLEPDTTYYYVVVAVNDIGSGRASSAASATTLPEVAGVPVCPAVKATSGQVAYPGGYSLVGLPGNTVVGSQSPLYGWFDQGAGSGYSLDASTAPVIAGRGYWAWSRCPTVVDLAAGSESVQFDLGAYRASMLGNPSSTSPAKVSGHDFAARWDATLNNGAGGYAISGYREPQALNIGEGIWAFNFQQNQISVDATR